jgi:hypothetical protein
MKVLQIILHAFRSTKGPRVTSTNDGIALLNGQKSKIFVFNLEESLLWGFI